MSLESEEKMDDLISKLDELNEMKPFLLDAADFAESAYMQSEKKDVELNNIRDYALSMLESVVDRLGSVADSLADIVTVQVHETKLVDAKVTSLEQRVHACWEYSGRDALRQQLQTKVAKNSTKHIQLPGDRNRPLMPHIEEPFVRETVDWSQFLGNPSRTSDVTLSPQPQGTSPFGPKYRNIPIMEVDAFWVQRSVPDDEMMSAMRSPMNGLLSPTPKGATRRSIWSRKSQ